jgi:hypothetical protein
MTRIFLVFSFLLVTTVISADESGWVGYKQSVLEVQRRVDGWCSTELADKLMDIVYETRPLLIVEIGTLGGSATFPMVCSLQFLNQGTIYAIDAWDHDDCLEGFERDDPLRLNWMSLNIDLDFEYKYFLDWLTKMNLKKFCIPMRLRSDHAVNLFLEDSIDFLYIDGNLSSKGSLKDVTLYFPKVAPGGYICLNYANLPSKSKATGFLMKHCEWIREKSIGIQTLVFKKTKGL